MADKRTRSNSGSWRKNSVVTIPDDHIVEDDAPFSVVEQIVMELTDTWLADNGTNLFLECMHEWLKHNAILEKKDNV